MENGQHPHPFLVTGAETYRIQFDDDNWIDIARSVTGKQRARWTDAATTYSTKVEGKGRKATSRSEMNFSNERYLEAFLRDVVKGWSSPDPLDANLISEVATKRIQEEFDRLNPSSEEDETLGESESPSLAITA